MAIKLITLNIEGSFHLDKFIPFLKKQNANVICLQEVFKKDFPTIQAELNMPGYFFPCCNKVASNSFTNQGGGVEGLAFFTNLSHGPIKAHYYVGTGTIPIFKDPNSSDVALVYGKVKDEKTGKEFSIATTHFTWTPDGEANEAQRKSFKSLMDFLKNKSTLHQDLLLCGDFNSPRGKETYQKFKQHFTDFLPKEVISTIDSKHHRKKNLVFAVDTIFSTKQYQAISVQVFDNLSDHKAIVATIKRI